MHEGVLNRRTEKGGQLILRSSQTENFDGIPMAAPRQFTTTGVAKNYRRPKAVTAPRGKVRGVRGGETLEVPPEPWRSFRRLTATSENIRYKNSTGV